MNKKIIWITGASSGIGREIAKGFAKEGHIVILTARRKTILNKLLQEIKPHCKEASAFVCDITSPKNVESVANRIIKKYGKIDGLINNAGVSVFKTFLDTTVTDYKSVIDTNLKGAFLCTKKVLPYMVKEKSGHIINILSVAANTLFEGNSVYSASKAGLLAMMNVLRSEVRKLCIKVTNILPGAVDTPMWTQETRRKYRSLMMQPTDIAKIAVDVFEQPKRVLIEDIVLRPLKGDL
ncbi:SDR family oxidoreductase [Bacteroidota bacterium]